MTPFDYQLLLVRLLPHAILIAGALVVLFLDQSRARHWNPLNRSVTAVFIGLLTVIVSILVITRQNETGSFYNDMLQITPFVRIVQIGLLILTAATLLIASPEKFTDHIGEYVALLLMGTTGLMLLAGSAELLTAFIALELTSLSLYLLAAFRKDSSHSAEAGLKYFLFGSVAAAFTLFGISLVFGLAGSTSFNQIGTALALQPLSPLLIAGLVLISIGFAFKMAAAPMHLWAPDVYQGAPVPSAAFIASGSKLASFVLFLKFFMVSASVHAGSASWATSQAGWSLIIAALAATSIIFGNLVAIAQSNVRRLIAYSAIAHAGYVLIALLARSQNGVASGVFYLFTYGLAVIGIFGVIGLVEKRHGELSFSDLRGLSRRSPLLAISLFVFILSLAGIPPLVGFFAKFYVFIAALETSRTAGPPGLLWIVVLAIAGSAVSLYYYLQVLKHAFVIEDPAAETSIIPIRFTQKLGISLLAVGVIFFGCFPNVLLRRLDVPGSTAPADQHEEHEHHTQSATPESSHFFADLR